MITLGSPFRLLLDDRYKTHAAFSTSSRSGITPHRPNRCSARRIREPLLEVPATAVYTRTDGVTSWQWCLEDVGPCSENIEVYGSHCGLGHNPAAIVAITDRLAQPEGEWKPFRSAARATPPVPH